MCGRFTHAMLWQDLVRLYRLTRTESPDGWEVRYNLAPSQMAPVARISGNVVLRELVMLKWGLVPRWAKDPEVGFSTINARAETVASKPTFREAFRRRRCLIPASGYFEWRTEGKGGKQPYHFARADGQIMTFVGLWEKWTSAPGGPTLETFTIIVGPANDQTRSYHHRMPSILEESEFDAWLDPRSPLDHVQGLLRPFAGTLEISAASRAVNNVANDSVDLLGDPPGRNDPPKQMRLL